MIDTTQLDGIRQRVKKLPDPVKGDRFEPHIWTDARTLMKMIEDTSKELKAEKSARRAEYVQMSKVAKQKSNEVSRVVEKLLTTQRAEYFFKKEITQELKAI